MIIIWSLVLIASLFFLIKSADYFTEYAEKIGLIFGMSSFIIGATIVAIGTSLPELVSSLFALGAGETSFVIDNIVGSNIANALLILGIGGVVARPLLAKTSLINVELPFFFMSMAGFSFFMIDKVISRGEGIALVGLLVVFIAYQIHQKPEIEDEEAERDIENEYQGDRSLKDIVKYITIVIGSVLVLAFSAKYLIDSILTLSDLLKISSSTLTITVVAFGTSLPEILTSVAAIKRGNHGMAIGNVLGSNTFNLLLAVGLPAIITPLSIAPLTYIVGYPFLIVATFIAIFVLFDNKVHLWEGVAMLFFYGIFIAKITGIM